MISTSSFSCFCREIARFTATVVEPAPPFGLNTVNVLRGLVTESCTAVGIGKVWLRSISSNTRLIVFTR